jgi:hypothetical protein
MLTGSFALAEYPSPVMRLACRRCEQRGKFRWDRLKAVVRFPWGLMRSI